MSQLVTAFTYLLMLIQNAVHATPGTQVATLVQQTGIHFPRGAVLKTLAVKFLTHGFSLRVAEGTGRGSGYRSQIFFPV